MGSTRATRTCAGRAVAFFLTLAVCAGVAPVASAEPGDLERGIEAYEHQDYDTALSLIRPLADAGNTEALYFMGTFYLYGAGVEMNPIEANTWFRRAYDQWAVEANAGKASSMVEVGMMLNTGIGVDRDAPKALEWLRRAADLGEVSAWTELGNLYIAGDGVPRDRAEARRWYEKAVGAGDEHAAYMLTWLDKHSDEEIDGMHNPQADPM